MKEYLWLVEFPEFDEQYTSIFVSMAAGRGLIYYYLRSAINYTGTQMDGQHSEKKLHSLVL